MEPFPKCAVCSTSFRYRGPQPHLLPCLHPVCEDCLKSCELKTRGCSVCLKSHTIHEGHIPVDEVIRAEVFNLTSKHRPSEFLCTNEEDGNQAVCWCGECGDFLCEHCQVLHAGVKSTRSHATTLIPDLSKKVKGSQPGCEKHGQSLDIFDIQCDNFICSRCFYQDHAGHRTTKAHLFLSTEEEKLNKCLESATGKKEELDLAMNDVNEQTGIIQEITVSLKETVQHTFAELKAMIEQREKEVLVELSHILDFLKNINESRRPVLESSGASCQTVLDYINKTLLYASPSHLHKLKSTITRACESCEKVDVPFVHKNESAVMFSKQGLQDVKSLISCFGSFFVSAKDKDQVTKTASFRSGRELQLESTVAQLRDQKLKMAKEIGELKGRVQDGVQVVNDLDEKVARLNSFVIQVDPDGGNRDMFLHAVRGIQGDVRVVKCPKMIMDAGRLSTDWAHINDNGVLVNYEKRTLGHLSYFSKFCCTSSTFPLPSTGLVYWEVEAEVELDIPLAESRFVLEVGASTYLGKPMDSIKLILAGNRRDNQLGVYIMQNGDFLTDVQYGGAFKAGMVVRLKYGVLVNIDTRSVNFIDILLQKMLACGRPVNLTNEAKIWPVFGIYCGYTKVAMRLVSGGEVQMDGWKKDLIRQWQFQV